ncbi:MAG TPA: tRNA uridine-5-carboxymethylaminomethyl(34) synthesis enzyme MnmG [Chloroflexus aurantiacus]|jgi:tRNA uridine 5-carboxymethylaminomethyl modification enzyme|uniref:tRNA uridine 5-carboxymethylaminomethyl modification enzyme MnmG n=1 Tax=Chloroflexus aurantiacus (strain ATCC 29366 / DSM 635 / J-10-fl) TaxID=324602 RepID=MNMG_CHLAA|nr:MULTISPECIES: tRNA uridine-5-carboxymethylaminomethyl(34) synthesis enzyme MnmG [Chloroflexus]A9WKL7.1 RecName: Full=tRNA uridine 5-carboxymethylaminomethyl modification enzyme MnmG; AltName: Full=Glucose-inhibited division protein A [Chloroflexus aurantiacus J-10-fl]ABY36645.1 glucose inhibited division protein A [Chloroflexus aurantiacus J-10-fl]HBW67703.1 tRNA uridine-5-carboxymethylaminomethyl(34) synthesis enzyme MnmG [Chloroflexus aurantiacus]
MQTRYDVIVVGAGHAGCEAAHAAARLGCRTLLLTIDLDKLAHMSCNPSIGGPAKGHLVREIDALGGLMGRITDRSAIQIRLLNESKGPAVQSLRAQCDKRLYARLMKETLERVPNLDLRQAMVERIAPPNADTQCFTVTTHTGWRYLAPAVILTTGTFLRGRAITGEAMWGAGRAGEAPAMALSEDLAALGFPLVRLKTGTPPRLAAATIDFSLTELQPGSDTPLSFGHYYPELGETIPPPEYHGPPAPVYPHPQLDGWRPQLPCYQVHTTPEFHAIIRENLHRAPLFSGIIEGVGPRYCPSIEDKIVRFADKERHGLFLEPEGWTTSEVYVQGCNTSLPEDVQWAMLRSIPALRNVELMRIGYAIEYDAVATGEITADMQTRRLRGLFFAGQINGTTGYEEAAAQGLMAGINAAHYVQGKPPVILGRAEAYIGVLIDDLTTKEIREPYRMFTSRAEYRLLLRGDNADLRLTPLAYRLGLVDGERAAVVEARRQQTEHALQQMRERRIFPSAAVNASLEAHGIKPISQPVTVAEVLARPEVRYTQLRDALPDLPALSDAVIEQVEIGCKYSGYIARQEREVARMQKMEHRRIPPDFDYTSLPGLRNEARQVLMRFRPATLGQAGRLAGINPADVAIILFALERRQGDQVAR